MPVKVIAATVKGGAVELGPKREIWASYAVATAGDLPAAEIFMAGVKLVGGKTVQLFVNRETGLVVVDIVARDGRGGNEILRKLADHAVLPARRI